MTVDTNIPSLKILFIDDHPLVASGLSALLAANGHAVSSARNLSQARNALSQTDTHYDAILLDINLGEENGLDLLPLSPGLSSEPCSTRIILLSGIGEQEWIFRGFELGAFGFIPKSIEPDELATALKEMIVRPDLPGSGWVWDARTRKIQPATESFPRETILTPKEREVFMLLREGKLDKQIADHLGLSIHTVRVHIRAIKRKRGHNRRFEQSI